MKFQQILLALLLTGFLSACGGGGDSNSGAIMPGNDDYTTLQTALGKAKAGDTIRLGEGTFKLQRSISLLADSVVLIGAGHDKTILSFKGQNDGAEGLRLQGNYILVQDLAIEDSQGDGLKAQDCDHITIRNLRVEWTGKADSTNGAYGIYPVETQNILIEGCDVKGASDAGIYLGQSLYGVIRNNKVHGNVAGIEVENSDYVDLHDNEVFNNTCGIMIFDLPDLKRKNGKFVRVFNNKVYDNNHPNFSSQGIAVYVVPYGVGLVLMAAQNIEVFNNTFTGNNTVGFTLLDLTAADELYGDRARKDTLFDIFPSSMYIYDNKFERNKDSVPDLSRPLGQFLVATLQKNIPDILVMTKYNPKYMEGGKLKPEHSICMKNNQGTVLNIYTKKTNLSEFDCERTKIDPVKIPQL